MKARLSMVFCLISLSLVAFRLQAQEGSKEVTLKGTVLCAKCTLKEAKKCETAIQVKEGEKVVTYYFSDKGSSETYHHEVCGGAKKAGTVIGSVFEKGGKKYVTPKKVEYAKK